MNEPSCGICGSESASLAPNGQHDGAADSERLIASWASRTGLSEHTKLEIAHAIHEDRSPGDAPPLDPSSPVPGCACPRCLTLAAGGTWNDGELARDFVVILSRMPPQDRVGAIHDLIAECDRLGVPVTLPRPAVLTLAATRVPGAQTDDGDDDDEDRRVRSRPSLPVDEAARVPILEIAGRLGLGTPLARGDEYAVLCPLHSDTNPSLYLNTEKNLWYCFPCDVGGDGIALVRETRGLSFPDAVRWIVGR